MKFREQPPADTVTRWEPPRVPQPDMKKLVSLGEATRIGERLTDHGRETVVQTFELFCEWSHGGGGNRYWHRYKSDPGTLHPQFDDEPRDRVTREQPLTETEKMIYRALTPIPPRPAPEPETVKPAFERPDW